MKQSEVVRVKDVMQSNFDMVNGMATVADMLLNAKHLSSNCVIVDKRHSDDEYGIVLLSDVAKKVLAKDRAPERVNVYEIMSKPVIAVDPAMDIRYCTRLFQNFGLNRAPVIDEGKVIGTVGYSNIVLYGIKERL